MKALDGIDLLKLQPALKLSRNNRGFTLVFDPLRKKYIRTTPEEIVRQLWIIYLLEVEKLNSKLIAVERAFKIQSQIRRFDLVVFDKSTHPVLLAEFKGPAINIYQAAFDQIARYNMQLNVPYSLLSNGTKHFCFQIDETKQGFLWQDKLPFTDRAN